MTRLTRLTSPTVRVTVPEGGQLVTKPLTITPQLILNAIATAVTEAIAFGILSPGLGQKFIAIAGIAIPAVVSIAQALHLGPIHAALVARAQPTAAAAEPAHHAAAAPHKAAGK